MITLVMLHILILQVILELGAAQQISQCDSDFRTQEQHISLDYLRT